VPCKPGVCSRLQSVADGEVVYAVLAAAEDGMCRQCVWKERRGKVRWRGGSGIVDFINLVSFD
jgi:hypothetical protein